MGNLKNLHDKLYKDSAEAKKRKLSEDKYNPFTGIDSNVTQNRKEFQETESKPISQDRYELKKEAGNLVSDEFLGSKKESSAGNKRKKIIIASAVLVGLAVIFLGFFAFTKYRESAYQAAKVQVEVEGPSQLSSGKQVKYKIRAINGNRASLQQAVLKISYSSELTPQEANFYQPEGFHLLRIDVGTIQPHQAEEYEINFNVFGVENNQVHVEAMLIYQPEGFSSTFVQKGEKSATIISSALSLILLTPQEAASAKR
jgi:hypothetical protein